MQERPRDGPLELKLTSKHVQLWARRVCKVQREAACSALPAGRRAGGGVQRERQRGIRRALVPRGHRASCGARQGCGGERG